MCVTIVLTNIPIPDSLQLSPMCMLDTPVNGINVAMRLITKTKRVDHTKQYKTRNYQPRRQYD